LEGKLSKHTQKPLYKRHIVMGESLHAVAEESAHKYNSWNR